MQLPITSPPVRPQAPAPAAELPTSRDEQPTYVGLRVSRDREFSAPMYADRVHDLAATDVASALAEARALLAKGAFDGTVDAAKAVVLLAGDSLVGPGGQDPVTTFRAGSLVELRMGTPRPVAAVPRDDAHFEYWYEPGAAAVLDADEFELTR